MYTLFMIIVDPAVALRRLVRTFGTQRAAADILGVTPSYFHDLLRGRRSCSDRILGKLHLRRVIVAVRRKART
jgi:DNA-binding transcriptional regulator YdaS (Cro superfamily)